MSSPDRSGSFGIGEYTVNRLGYGAMQLAGPGVFGPPITNQIIREALAPYRDDLVIVTKVSARRGADGSWIPAMSREELTQAVHDNLRNLGLDVLPVVNLRSMFNVHRPAEGSIEAPLSVLADLQFFPLGGFTPMQVALAWLMRRAPNILLIPGTSSVAHLRENMADRELALSPQALAELDGIAAAAPALEH